MLRFFLKEKKEKADFFPLFCLELSVFWVKSRKWSKNMIFFYQKVESDPRIWYFSIKKLKALSDSDSIFLVIGKTLAKVIGFGRGRIDNRKNLTIHQVLSDF